MNDCNKNKESYLKYWDVNNLYGWVMWQKVPVNNFEWIEDAFQFNEDFMKSYNEESDEGYFPEVDVQYPEKLHEPHDDLPFLPEIMKTEKVEEIVSNLDDKTECIIHIKNLKQALNHRLFLKNVNSVVKFSKNIWLKSYIDMNTKLKKNK